MNPIAPRVGVRQTMLGCLAFTPNGKRRFFSDFEDRIVHNFVHVLRTERTLAHSNGMAFHLFGNLAFTSGDGWAELNKV
jgi:hypothetical protein